MSDIPLSSPTSEPSSSITVTSTNQFDKQTDFKEYILSSLYQVKEYHEFVFTNVPSSWGEAVLRLIDESITSRKEPDFFFQVNDHILPTLVVECGWSESKERIYDDMNLLLVGGNGSIKVVIIVKWAKLGGSRVSGTVELFMRDRNDMPFLKQTETVFPRPTTTNRQRLEIRRGDLFGDALLAGRNRNDILYLDVERLRDHATRSLGFMNLVPA
ncbi:hypothetical protein DTO271G3_6499 [Paecilomyces variotii]|nr:hypothetical protein DTO271G3_6499 [Paecilomyces variotii]